MVFREELRQVLGGSEELLYGWLTTTEVVRETVRKVFCYLDRGR